MINTADEASVFEDLLLLLLLASQIGKRVDNHTENQVQNDNNNNEIKKKVVHNSRSKRRFLFRIIKLSLTICN